MIKKVKERLLNSPLLKNTLYLASGTVLAQLISVLVSPLLSRIYTPEDFGILGKIMAFTSIFVGISTLKYDLAIVLSKSVIETKHLINWSEFFIVITSLLAIPIYIFIYSSLDIYILVSIFLIIFLNSNFYLFTNILTRYKKFKKLSYDRVVNKITNSTTQLSLGYFNVKEGLIIGLIVGLISFFGYLSRNASNSVLKIFKFNKKTFKEAHPVLRNHYRFPLYMAPQSLLNILSQNTPILIMEYFFGGTVIGLYYFAFKILQIPIVSISFSVRQTFYQKAASIKSNKILLKFLIKSTRGLFLLGLPFAILGFFTLPQLFNLIFGEEWTMAGEYAKWLLPWLFMAFINPPAISMISVLNLQKFNLKIDVVLLLFRILAVYIGGVYFDPITTIKIFSSVGVFFNIIIMYYIYFSIKKNINLASIL